MAILWNKCIDQLINVIEFGNERIKCIELNIKQNPAGTQRQLDVVFWLYFRHHVA